MSLGITCTCLLAFFKSLDSILTLWVQLKDPPVGLHGLLLLVQGLEDSSLDKKGLAYARALLDALLTVLGRESVTREDYQNISNLDTLLPLSKPQVAGSSAREDPRVLLPVLQGGAVVLGSSAVVPCPEPGEGN